jgi:hypothetical protein
MPLWYQGESKELNILELHDCQVDNDFESRNDAIEFNVSSGNVADRSTPVHSERIEEHRTYWKSDDSSS